jgi:hypothetical protein
METGTIPLTMVLFAGEVIVTVQGSPLNAGVGTAEGVGVAIWLAILMGIRGETPSLTSPVPSHAITTRPDGPFGIAVVSHSYEAPLNWKVVPPTYTR